MNTKFVRGLILFSIVGLTVLSVSFDPVFAASKDVIIPSGAGLPDCASTNSCFSPSSITISVGDKVVWKNWDSVAHTVTSGDLNVDPDNVGTVFDSGLFTKVRFFSFKFTKSGTYPYVCIVHPWMTGSVIVKEQTLPVSFPEPIQKSPNDQSMDWEIIYVTSFDKCHINDQKSLLFYYKIANQYLSKYNIDHSFTGIKCISKNNMYDVIQDAVTTSDLTIIIPDFFQSFKQSLKTNTWGHYEWYGDEKTILSQSLSLLKAESKESAWVLSHELSHFALDWKGYPRSISGDGVHKIENEYRYCKKQDVTLAYCTNIWTTVKTPSGKSMPIMKPLYTVDYVKESSKQTKPTNPTLNNLDRVTVKSINIYKPDASYYSASNSLHIGDDILVEASILNNQAKKQSVAAILQIQDSSGNTVNTSWVTISLNSKDTRMVAFSWIPKTSGTHIATFYLWESVDNNTPVAPVKTVSFQVYD